MQVGPAEAPLFGLLGMFLHMPYEKERPVSAGQSF